MILRVKKVLVGDSDFAFVHAIGSDGAEFKMELPVPLGRTLKRDALIQVDVKPVSLPEQIDELERVIERAVSSLATSALNSNAPTSGINDHRSVPTEDPTSTPAKSSASDRAVSSSATGALGQRAAPRRMSSPDPRAPKSNSADPLRRLLGL